MFKKNFGNVGSAFKKGYYWLEKLAILIGMMGGLKGIVDIWQSQFPSYNFEIMRSAPVTITYDSKQNDLLFTLGLILNNRGTTSDAIERCRAELRLPTDSSRHCMFGDLDIAFKDGSNQFPKNLPIQKDASKSVTCEISAYMTDELLQMFRQHETRRELVITLFGHGRMSYPVKFLFNFGDDVPTTLFDPSSKEPVSLTFVGSDR